MRIPSYQVGSQLSLAATLQHDFRLSSRFLNLGEMDKIGRLARSETRSVCRRHIQGSVSDGFLIRIEVAERTTRDGSDGAEDGLWRLPPQMDACV
jgi:hypothetical protein